VDAAGRADDVSDVYGREGQRGPADHSDEGAESEREEQAVRVTYRGERGRRGEWRVFRNHRPLSPRRSLKVRNHSPTGFSWGFGGSGPAQLALALLLDVVGRDEAQRYYQAFKWEWVVNWPQDGPWEMCESEIRRWVGMMSRRNGVREEVGAAITS
jgi:hypothetical protein